MQLGSTDGYEPLKRELIALFRSEGLNVRGEQLLITDGCQQAIDLVCKAFLRPGDSVALENPGYPGAIAILAGARVRTLAVGVETDPARTGHVGLDVDALETVLLQNRVKFLLVTPDFHNPTGTVLPLAERRRLLELAAHYQVPVVEDGIYARLRAARQCGAFAEDAGHRGECDSHRQLFEDGVPRPARRLVHRRRERDRAAAPGEAIDRPAHGPAFASGDGGVHAPRVFREASREDAEDVSEPPGGDGGGARKAYAGRDVVDASRGRHDALGDVAAGVRCRRAADSRARARNLVPARAIFLFAAAPAEYACVSVSPPWTRSESRRESKSWPSC